jgi:hypothetical protein
MSNADHTTEIGSFVDCYDHCVRRGLAGPSLALRGQLASQAALQADDLNNLTQAALRQQQTEQHKRLDTKQQLAVSDQQHTRELPDAKRNQALLRDRLATADVRLSVLLDSTAPSQ